MAKQVEKMPQEETPEVLLVVSDIPEPEEQTSNQEAELLLPVNPNPNILVNHEPVKSQDKAPHHEEEEEEEENGTKIADLAENDKKALQELKHLVQNALSNHDFSISASSSPKEAKTPLQEENKKTVQEPGTEKDSNNTLEPFQQKMAKTLLEDVNGAKTLEAIEETIVKKIAAGEEKEVSIWGVKLMEDEKTDVILLKFLRARDFKVKDAFAMLKNTLKWRKEFGIEDLVEKEDLGINDELERVVFMHGYSKEAGNPVCYNVYGEFRNKELYQKMFSDEEKREKFLRWRVQFLEKSIRKLDFGPGGVSTIVQVNDLKNSPGPNRWELRQATNHALHLLQDNYPEFVAKQVFINVPWWYLALSKMISPFMTQRTKSKFVVASPSTTTETLLKYISAEQLPTQYGGLSKEDGDFGMADNVTEIIVKPSAKHIVEFPVTQTCNVRWEVRVVGWEVGYGAEYVPNAEGAYTIIIQKKMMIINGSTQEQVICGSYNAGEPGKLVITIDNLTSKKKKLLYRFKIN